MAISEKAPAKHDCLSYVLRWQIKFNARNSDAWAEDDSPIEIYEELFEDVLGDITIVEFVKSRPSPIVIDLMSQSAALASLFRLLPRGHCQLGLSVALSDKRTGIEETQNADSKIKHLAGDILSNDTWKKIDNELVGRKADLIMERANAGLTLIPHENIVHAVLLRKAWKILNKNGGMLIFETPSIGYDKSLDKWVNYLKENCVDAVYDREIAVKIIRTPNSPEKLPFLK